MGDIKCLVANPDLGSTKPPTFFGNCIEIPRDLHQGNLKVFYLHQELMVETLQIL